MKRISLTKQSVVQLAKFAASSFTSFLLDYALFYVLTLAGADVTYANVLARLVSASVNYTINRRLVFRKNERASASAWRYALTALVVLAGNTLVLRLLADMLGVNRYAAKLLTECVFFIFNWLAQRLFVFAVSKQSGDKHD